MSIAELERRLDKVTDPSVGELITRYGTNLNKLKMDTAQGKIDPTKALMAKMAIDRIVAANTQPPAQGSVFQEQMAPAGLPAVPMRPDMFQGMAGGGIVAMAVGGLNSQFLNEVGLTEADFGLRGSPRSLRNRYEEFYGLQKEFGGEDEEAKLYREALLKRQAALEGRRSNIANEALLQFGLGMLGTQDPYFFRAAGTSGKEAFGQYQAAKARQEAEELDVAKGLAGLAGRSRAEKLAALGKAYEAQTAEEREAARLAGQKEVAQIQATRGTNMSIFVDNAVDNARAQARTKGRELSPSEEAQIRAAADERYIELFAALGPRGVSAQAAADQAKTAEFKESRIPVSEAIEAWNKLGILDPAKKAYMRLSSEADRLDSANNPQAANEKRMKAERIKEDWLKNASRRQLGSSSNSNSLSANPNDPLGLRK